MLSPLGQMERVQVRSWEDSQRPKRSKGKAGWRESKHSFPAQKVLAPSFSNFWSSANGPADVRSSSLVRTIFGASIVGRPAETSSRRNSAVNPLSGFLSKRISVLYNI